MQFLMLAFSVFTISIIPENRCNKSIINFYIHALKITNTLLSKTCVLKNDLFGGFVCIFYLSVVERVQFKTINTLL